jgi:hypothetical protein
MGSILPMERVFYRSVTTFHFISVEKDTEDSDANFEMMLLYSKSLRELTGQSDLRHLKRPSTSPSFTIASRWPDACLACWP